uniref:Intermembrane lipid transfer protein VPS13-like C-terminal domain-containing protein n=1 Tax=Arcella intermedia TaxID=1963864 RepID=A0A6B2LFT6_9EUKA
MGMGFLGLGKGLLEGVSGVVTQPIKGAQEDGAVGFMKGLGIGIVGLALKPSIGAIDLVTKTTEGIANTSIMEDSVKTKRKTLPKTFEGPLLLPYDNNRAYGQYVLCTMENGLYKNHVYKWFTNLDEAKKNLVIFSQTHVFIISKNSFTITGKTYEANEVFSLSQVLGCIEKKNTLLVKVLAKAPHVVMDHRVVFVYKKPSSRNIPESATRTIEIQSKDQAALKNIEQLLYAQISNK